MGGVKEMTGLRFGSLGVIARADNTPKGQAVWRCLCDCGRVVTAKGYELRNGTKKSCGCYKVACLNEYNTKHGATGTRLHRIWCNIKDRCYRENHKRYADYGGRGITVCEEWRESFLAFKEWALSNGYSDAKTIDRKDNDGPYSPVNCRWATRKEQNNNTRKNRLVTYNGETHTISEWADRQGLTYNALLLRLKRGWPVSKALTTPMKTRCEA